MDKPQEGFCRSGWLQGRRSDSCATPNGHNYFCLTDKPRTILSMLTDVEHTDIAMTRVRVVRAYWPRKILCCVSSAPSRGKFRSINLCFEVTSQTTDGEPVPCSFMANLRVDSYSCMRTKMGDVSCFRGV